MKVLATGASEIQQVFKGQDLTDVLAAYMVGIKEVFAFSLAGAAFTVLVAFVIPFKKLPSQDSKAENRAKTQVSHDSMDRRACHHDLGDQTLQLLY